MQYITPSNLPKTSKDMRPLQIHLSSSTTMTQQQDFLLTNRAMTNSQGFVQNGTTRRPATLASLATLFWHKLFPTTLAANEAPFQSSLYVVVAIPSSSFNRSVSHGDLLRLLSWLPTLPSLHPLHLHTRCFLPSICPSILSKQHPHPPRQIPHMLIFLP